jgi:hypothetical protein
LRIGDQIEANNNKMDTEFGKISNSRDDWIREIKS